MLVYFMPTVHAHVAHELCYFMPQYMLSVAAASFIHQGLDPQYDAIKII